MAMHIAQKINAKILLGSVQRPDMFEHTPVLVIIWVRKSTNYVSQLAFQKSNRIVKPTIDLTNELSWLCLVTTTRLFGICFFLSCLIGNCSRKCSIKAIWEHPDMSFCVSPKLDELDDQVFLASVQYCDKLTIRWTIGFSPKGGFVHFVIGV